MVLCGTEWSLRCMVESLFQLGSRSLQGVRDGDAYAPVKERRFMAQSFGPQQSNNPLMCAQGWHMTT